MLFENFVDEEEDVVTDGRELELGAEEHGVEDGGGEEFLGEMKRGIPGVFRKWNFRADPVFERIRLFNCHSVIEFPLNAPAASTRVVVGATPEVVFQNEE